MATSRRKKWAVGLGIAGLILAAYALVSPYLLPWYEHRRVEHLLADFRANPGKVTIEPLIQTLYDGRASQADGDAVLGELLKVKPPKCSVVFYGFENLGPGRNVSIDVGLYYPEVGLLQDPSLGVLGLWQGVYSTQLDGTHSSMISFEGRDKYPNPQTFPNNRQVKGTALIGFGNPAGPPNSGQSKVDVGSFAVCNPGTYKGTIVLKFEFWKFTPTWQPTPWYENVLRRLGLVRDRPPEKPRIYRCQCILPFEAHVGKDAWEK